MLKVFFQLCSYSTVISVLIKVTLTASFIDLLEEQHYHHNYANIFLKNVMIYLY